MQDQIFKAALSGLLHDVGKLVQRARPDPWKKPETYLEEDVPVHAAWSGEFIWQYVPERWRGEVLSAMYHHRPEASPAADRSLSELVALADKLSAGERSDSDRDHKERFPMQLRSIFDRISLDGQEKTAPAHYLPLAALALQEDALFAKDAWSEERQRKAYEQLVQTLESDAGRARSGLADNPEAYLEAMLSALQRTTWCVPSAYYYSLPDVSLYDHSRMTAALAVCLSELEPARVTEMLGVVQRNFTNKPQQGDAGKLSAPAALLVGGDLSGIQDFIYTISSKEAAKSLRGRSFYLQLLTEAVLRFVLRGLGLPTTNVIYSGGGHFYLLAPLSAAEKLPALQAEITRKLLKHHGVSLYLALGFAQVPFAGFCKGSFSAYWDEMHQKLSRAKQKRYTELGPELYDRLFVPQKHGGNQEKLCAVCGQEREDVHEASDAEGEKYRICALCRSFADPLGKHLPLSRGLALGLDEPRERQPGSALDALAEFGVALAFVKDENAPLEWLTPDAAPERVVLWAFEDRGAAPRGLTLPLVVQQRYTVNQIPEMTFDQLAKVLKEGIPRLGVLRMDVDDLGMVFQKGFYRKDGQKSIATLARVSTLSFQMSLFFEGWVKRLVEPVSGDKAGKPLIYSVYAGGDDVFLIGPWSRMPALARDIAEDFKRYTGGNPDLHLSGGMSFIHGKYPVYQAAEDAGQVLEQAKDRSGKDAFAFLGGVWSWQDFKAVDEKRVRLVKIMKMDGAPQSLLQLLQRLAEQEAKKRKDRPGKRVWGPWMWIGDYQLTRMAERASGDLKQEIQAVLSGLRENLYADLPDWGKAARWAQLFLRTQKND